MKYRKDILVIIIILLIFTLVACGDNKQGNNQQENNQDRTDERDNNETVVTFIGVIEEINGDMALVAIEEGEILKSGSLVDVDLSVSEDKEFKVGDRIKVAYDGDVMERHPLGINTSSVELLE